MIKKIFRIELSLFSLFATLNLVYFFGKESLSDNYYSISSSSQSLSHLSFYLNSVAAHIGYYTGLWLAFSLLFFAIYFVTARQKRASVSPLAVFLFILPAVVPCYLVFPDGIGGGLLSLMTNHLSTNYLCLALVINLGVIFYLVNPDFVVQKYQETAQFLEPKNLLSLIRKVSFKKLLKQKKKAKPEMGHYQAPTAYIENKVEEKSFKEQLVEKIKPSIEKITPIKKIEEVEVVQEVSVSEKATPKVRKANFFKSDDLIDCITREDQTSSDVALDKDYFDQIIQAIEQKFSEFNIQASVINVMKGPVVDTFEITLGAGVKVSDITKRTDDLSLALWGAPIRMVYPMKGKTTIGIEVPRNPREVIYLDDVLRCDHFRKNKHRLPIAMGKDAYGDPTIFDLATMPHMLVAGSTGAGKSVFINTILVSLIIKMPPEKLKLILIDPKQLELALYQSLPHLILPVMTDPKTSSIALLWAVEEMEKRYGLMKELGVRNIDGYNQKVPGINDEQRGKLTKYYKDGLPDDLELPYMVIIVDEFADLVLSSNGKEIEKNISRLAAKARAAGIHIILATQRPSTDVITGVIKANFPTRVSFRVTSSIDSRVVLDTLGADKLLGKGDMLFKMGVDLMRLHSSYVDEEEIETLVAKLDSLPTEFSQEAMDFIEENTQSASAGDSPGEGNGEVDKLFDEAVAIVAEMRMASASMLQRRLRVGYNRAANLVEEMERRGIVGPQQGSKPRAVLIAVPDEQ